MYPRDCRYEAVHRLDGPPDRFTARDQSTPFIGNGAIS
jgi:hypothetical protein